MEVKELDPKPRFDAVYYQGLANMNEGEVPGDAGYDYRRFEKMDKEQTLYSHYLKHTYFTGKYLELAGQRRKKEYVSTCKCGFRATAFGKQLADCKILGHQETCLAGYRLAPMELPEEKGMSAGETLKAIGDLLREYGIDTSKW